MDGSAALLPGARHHVGEAERPGARFAEVARRHEVSRSVLLATGEVRYHHPDQRRLAEASLEKAWGGGAATGITLFGRWDTCRHGGMNWRDRWT